ncbi:hypothetical protein [Actinocrispum wychmicini]|uniref:Carbohydrate binding protein n=1 Tax=Actinocrispum wychmicini TaxID=1213861 RepID=A0A4R2JEY8_9PSEU|nr:hypothetical protein [Actinocrispum wychmicini]TCO57117.1 hypothetical protein EV192_106594 [Actinocrispum wychmicini]
MVRPLFDFVADFTAGPPAVPGAAAVSLNSVAGTRTQAWQTRRGRQYELGNAEAGTMTVSVFDRAETLNPANTSSAWNSGANTLLPYRCIQRAGLWNAASSNLAGNVLNSTNTPPGSSTAYDPSFETTVAWTSVFGTAATRVVSTTQAFAGTHSCAATLTASSDRVGGLMWTVPGQTYTLSVYVYVPATYTVTLVFGQYSPTVTTYGSATSSTTAAWQRLSVTATATNAVSYLHVKSGTAPGFPFTVYLDACQLELASSASAFTTTGPKRSPRYTGYIERYPQTWTDAGFRGVKPLEAVDALSVLSRTVINQTYQSTIAADNPYIYIPYTDQALPLTVQLPKGGQPYLAYTSVAPSGQVNLGGDTFLDGSAAANVSQQNDTPPTASPSAHNTYLGTQGMQTMIPNAFTIEAWVKLTSGTAFLGAATIGVGENVYNQPIPLPDGPRDYLGWYTTGGQLMVFFTNTASLGFGPFVPNPATWTGFPDGQWHYLAICLRASGGGFDTAVDGAFNSWVWSPAPTAAQFPIMNLFVEATTGYGTPTTSVSVAQLAAYPAALSSSQLLAHYKRGIGYINELAGARVARLLNTYWSATAYTAAAGYAKLAPDFGYDDANSPQSARTMLDVLQEITATENSFLYASADGRVVWEDRASRYTQQTSAATIGNSAGQLHPEGIEYDYDPTYVYSQANLSRPANSNFAPQINATSQTAYGQRILSATLQVNSDFDLSQAAIFYLNRYSKPGGAPGLNAPPRVRRLVLSPASDPTMWNFVLGLELSQRITVAMRTSAGTLITGDYYVEAIAEQGSPADGSYTVELQCSPVFVPTAWILGDSTYGVLGTSTVPVY